MALHNLTASQLRRVAAIKERLESFNKELDNTLGAARKSDGKPKKTMSTTAKRKIAATSITLMHCVWASCFMRRNAVYFGLSGLKGARVSYLASAQKARWATFNRGCAEEEDEPGSQSQVIRQNEAVRGCKERRQ
jgi:hypothetical protein